MDFDTKPASNLTAQTRDLHGVITETIVPTENSRKRGAVLRLARLANGRYLGPGADALGISVTALSNVELGRHEFTDLIDYSNAVKVWEAMK